MGERRRNGVGWGGRQWGELGMGRDGVGWETRGRVG